MLPPDIVRTLLSETHILPEELIYMCTVYRELSSTLAEIPDTGWEMDLMLALVGMHLCLMYPFLSCMTMQMKVALVT